MSNLCPICSEKLEAAITFGLRKLSICIDCSYVKEILNCTICECPKDQCLTPYDHRDDYA